MAGIAGGRHIVEEGKFAESRVAIASSKSVLVLVSDA